MAPEPKAKRKSTRRRASIHGAATEGRAVHEELEAEQRRSEQLEASLKQMKDARERLERRVAELERQARSSTLLQQFVSAAPGALWVAEARTGRGMYVSPGLEALFGTLPEAILPEAGRWLKLVHGDDRATVTARFDTVRRGEAAEIEYRVMVPSPELGQPDLQRWVRDLGFPIRSAGQVRYVAGFVVDATERRDAEGLRRLLLAELNHRVRNTLATVHSLAAQTARGAPSPGAFWTAFAGRLHALARAHDRLSEGGWATGAELRTLIETEFAPHGSTKEGSLAPRTMLRGPSVQLEPGMAVTLALALHEMTTNAARHGAFSVPVGQVEVHWHVDARQPERMLPHADSWLHITWLERGGPPLHGPPQRRGFGSRLLERNLPRQLGGEVHLDYKRSGLEVIIAVPLRSSTANNYVTL